MSLYSICSIISALVCVVNRIHRVFTIKFSLMALKGDEMNHEFLGMNIQIIRKLKKFTQQELADEIGINLQSLSKIERGVNMPSFDTLDKIMSALSVTPNELLSGPLRIISHMESEILAFIDREARLDVELAHGQYDNYFDSEEEWLAYELQKLREYISGYINAPKRVASDLYPIKELVYNQKLKKLLSRYNNYYAYDLFSETLEGRKEANPYAVEIHEIIEKDENGDIKKSVEYPDDFDD